MQTQNINSSILMEKMHHEKYTQNNNPMYNLY